MGYAADFQLGKPVIEFIDNEIHGPKKKEATGVLGKVGEFFSSLFGSSTNADGTVNKGCLSSLADKVAGWKESFDDFEFKNLFKKKQSAAVFPDDAPAEEADAEVDTGFEF
jgi:hypothetical protein